MMGYELGAALKKARVPYVFMTGVLKGGRAASDARAQHGAAGYFEKPFTGKKLMDELRALLPAAPVERATTAPSPATLLDFDVDFAVDTDEPIEALELTGRVVLTEAGKVSAVLRGETITVGPLRTPSPAPHPHPPPLAATPAAREEARAARRAAELPPPEGTLGENLPDLITAFHLAQQTGELTVQRGKVKKTIYFEAGRPLLRHLQPGDRPLRPVPGARRQDHAGPARAGARSRRQDRAAHRRHPGGDERCSRRPRSSTTWPSR